MTQTASWQPPAGEQTPSTVVQDPRVKGNDNPIAVDGNLVPKADELNRLVDKLMAEWGKRADERDTALCERLDKELKEARAEFKVEVEKAAAVQQLSGAPNKGDKRGDWSLYRTARALCSHDWRGAELEREVGEEMAQKAMSFGVDSVGGYIVPENYTAEIIEKLDQENPLFLLGARMIPGVRGGQLVIPKQTSRASASWIGENDTITATDPGLGQIRFQPRTLAAATQVSNTLRENSTPEVEGFIFDDLRIQFDNAVTNAGLTGDGTNHSPTGILNENSIGTEGVGTGVLTYDDLVNLVHELMQENALRGSLGFCMHPDAWAAVMSMIDNPSTQPLARRVITEAGPQALMGYPFQVTTAMPGLSSTGDALVFGDWSQFIVPIWKTIELSATVEGAGVFLKDAMMVRAIMRLDMGVRHVESFAKITGF